MKSLFLLFFIAAATQLFSQTIENVDFRAEEKTIVISYDLLKRKDTTINIKVYFKSDKGEVITPKYLSGDLRNVHPGTSKQIIWDILKEGFYLSGRFLVEIKEKRAYRTTILGNQRWCAENLYTSKFRNGDEIPEAKTAEQWKKAILKRQPAWCYYNNDSKNSAFGKLYNWYAVNDKRGLAPKGWHVPSSEEWKTLKMVTYVNPSGNLQTVEQANEMDKINGNHLKSQTGWEPIYDPYRGKLDGNGQDTKGFSALPGGSRLPKEYDNYDYNDLLFQGIGWQGVWWTSSEKNNNEVYIYTISWKLGLKPWSESKGWGYFVRCVKDK